MRRLSVVLALGAATALMTGCGINSSQMAAVTPVASSMGAIQGSIYGGRQPINGSRVFLLSVGTNGYGTASTSLLDATGVGTGAATTQNPSGGTGAYGLFPNDYYVTTNANGFFSLTNDYTCSPGSAVYLVAAGGNSGGGADNPYTSLMALLGICPAAAPGSTTSTFSNTITFLQVNEVSTVAAAYALSGYETDAADIGVNNSTQGNVGLANAASISPLLFDPTSATAGASAPATTPNGNGTVPQALLDSLANTLASCVNTAPSGGSTTPSSFCSELFSDTPNKAGTDPVDTATAMMNIVHAPAVNVGDLFSLASNGVKPFSPYLAAAPTDFAVAIQYTTPGLLAPDQIAIDANGNAWIASLNSASLVALDPTGVPVTGTPYTSFNGSLADGLAIGPRGDIWQTNSACTSTTPCVYIFSGSNGAATGSPFSFGATLTGADGFGFDALGNAYIAGAGSGNIVVLTSSGTFSSSITDSTAFSTKKPLAAIHDGSSNIWVANAVDDYLFADNSSGPSTPSVTAGSPAFATGSRLALDSAGNVWQNKSSASVVYLLLPTGKAGANSPYAVPGAAGVAVDGTGNVFIPSTTNNSVYEVTNFSLISPNSSFAGYAGTGSYLYSPLSDAIDLSGNVWVTSQKTSSGGNSKFVSCFIGLASPTATPVLPGVYGTRP
jgi:hypothetical protein